MSTRRDGRAAALAEGRRADTARRRQRVLVALADAAAAGAEISVSGVARCAGVDRTFLYRHRDLLEKLHEIEAQLSASTDASPVATRASLPSKRRLRARGEAAPSRRR